MLPRFSLSPHRTHPVGHFRARFQPATSVYIFRAYLRLNQAQKPNLPRFSSLQHQKTPVPDFAGPATPGPTSARHDVYQILDGCGNRNAKSADRREGPEMAGRAAPTEQVATDRSRGYHRPWPSQVRALPWSGQPLPQGGSPIAEHQTQRRRGKGPARLARLSRGPTRRPSRRVGRCSPGRPATIPSPHRVRPAWTGRQADIARIAALQAEMAGSEPPYMPYEALPAAQRAQGPLWPQSPPRVRHARPAARVGPKRARSAATGAAEMIADAPKRGRPRGKRTGPPLTPAERKARYHARRAAAVARRPYLSARTGSEGLLGSRPPPAIPTTGPVSPSRRRPPEQPRRWNGPPVVRQLPRRAGCRPCSGRATPP